MYAIREMMGGGPSILSRDHLGVNWWTGARWSLASDEAKLYDSEQEAEAALSDCPSPGIVVDWDED